MSGTGRGVGVRAVPRPAGVRRTGCAGQRPLSRAAGRLILTSSVRDPTVCAAASPCPASHPRMRVICPVLQVGEPSTLPGVKRHRSFKVSDCPFLRGSARRSSRRCKGRVAYAGGASIEAGPGSARLNSPQELRQLVDCNRGLMRHVFRWFSQIPPTMGGRLILVVLGMLPALGCGGEPGTRRTIAVGEWDTVWQTDAAFMDSVIPSPGAMTFNQGRLYVVDRATPRIVALDARTGAYQWRAGRRGSGPEEFAGIASTYPDRDGGVAVVDIRNRRISRLNPDGSFAELISTGHLGQQPNQVCRYGDTNFLTADVFGDSLIEFDSLGTAVRRLNPLWPDLEGINWESHQVVLRSDYASDACLVALSTGRGFAILTAGKQPVVAPYVETFEVYKVGGRKDEGKMKFWATYQAALVQDTVFILFSGRTKDKDRLIDRYSAATGAYLDTYRLPFVTPRLTVGNEMVFVVDTSETRIVALRRR